MPSNWILEPPDAVDPDGDLVVLLKAEVGRWDYARTGEKNESNIEALVEAQVGDKFRNRPPHRGCCGVGSEDERGVSTNLQLDFPIRRRKVPRQRKRRPECAASLLYLRLG